MSSERLPSVPMTPIRHYQHREAGRSVLLVAAAHIADQGYYDTLQAALAEFEEAGGVVQHERIIKATPAELAALGRADRFRLAVSRYSDRTSYGWVGSGLVLQTAGITYGERWQQRDAHEVDFTRRVGALAILGEGVRTFLTNQVIGRFSPDLKRQLYVYTIPGTLEYAASNGIRKHGRESAATINYRNEVALAAFDEQVACEPARSVALLWGYGHFAGLAEGLQTRGYEQIGDDEWVPLFACDSVEQ